MANIFTTERRKLIFEIFDKFPEIADRTAARILFEKYPGFFSSIENARDNIRVYRGKKGKKLKSEIQIKKYYR